MLAGLRVSPDTTLPLVSIRDRFTVPVRPFCGVRVKFVVPLLPYGMAMLAGARERVKSGAVSPKALTIKIKNNAKIRTFFLGLAVSLVSNFFIHSSC
jgi:hypothetical protein